MEKTKIVIIGITGDYSRRMLLVSLDKLLSKNLINNVEIYGTSRNIKTPLEIINNSMIPNKDTSPLKNNLKIIKLDPSINDDFINFKNEINLQDNEQLIIYLSVPFTSAMSICDSLARNNINTKNVKIMIEKPFGNDLTSAHEFLDSIAKNFNEEQVYRVDHYLQKPACHKLINNIKDNTNNLHSMLNNNVTKEIDIVASEKIDIQGRGDFFEQTGTLRDFVQNHLMQLLSLILVGGDVNIDNLVEEKVNQLKHLHAIEGVRAQYDGYKSEVNNSYSKTETFVCLELESSYERWKGVKIKLISGKALDGKQTAIAIFLKNGVSETIDINAANEGSFLTAHDNIFMNAIAGNKDYFVSSEEIIESWKICQPILDKWAADDSKIATYPKGAPILDVVKN